MTKEDILKTLHTKKTFIQQKFGVEKIGLFGSYARNEAKEDSDIDFYVVLKEKSLDNMTGLWLFLEDMFDKKIDLLYYHPRLREGLKIQVEKEAVYA
jgi:predicted nucleotidyltransferase